MAELHLSLENLQDRDAWEAAGIELPHFDLIEMRRRTNERPRWLHFGGGNLFRAFPALCQQNLLNRGLAESGVIVSDSFDANNIEFVYRQWDNLALAATLKADGSIAKELVGSVARALAADPAAAEDWAELKELFRQPSLQVVSFTITEKAYNLRQVDGSYFAAVASDFTQGPAAAISAMGRVAALLLERFGAGALPITLLSMDNCSHNGDRLREAILPYFEHWVTNGLILPAALDWLNQPRQVAFPWSMIDKITPGPDASVSAMLQASGFMDTEGVLYENRRYAPPFVNAEETQYLVIEDDFPNGRPAWEETGVIFTDRQTVDKVEKMKVCTCLNPLHTCLAIFGCLLGFTKIYEEMRDPDLLELVTRVGYEEGLPVVTDPGILSPTEFLDTVLNKRFPNPFMPDTPQRIATDSSQKLAIRFGETIKAYRDRPGFDPSTLRLIPLVQAAWLRYLLGVDDAGQSFAPSPDPLLAEMQAKLSGIELGGVFDAAVLQEIFSTEKIFGVNLYEVGLGERAEKDFKALLAGPGAVRQTLQKALAR